MKKQEFSVVDSPDVYLSWWLSWCWSEADVMSMTDRLDSVITVRPLLHWYPLIIWTLNYPTQTSILLISMFLQNFDYHKDSQQVDDAGWWRSCIHSYFWQIDYWECFVECSQVCSLVISPDPRLSLSQSCYCPPTPIATSLVQWIFIKT